MVHGGAGGVRKRGLRGEGGPAAVAGPGLHAGQHRTPSQEQGQAYTTPGSHNPMQALTHPSKMTFEVGKNFLGKEPVFRIRIHFFRIRIQRLRLEVNTDPDPDPIRIQGFNDQKLKKNYSWKKKNFVIKNCNLPIPRPP